jgi:hypothetical protein
MEDLAVGGQLFDYPAVVLRVFVSIDDNGD